MGVGPGVRALDHPPLARRQGRWLPLLGDLGEQATGREALAGDGRIVPPIEMDDDGVRERLKARQGVERRLEQRRIVPVGGGRDRAEREALRFNEGRAFESLFAPIDGTSPGHLAAARRLRDATIDSQMLQLQADHPVVRIEHDVVQRGHHASVDPCVPAPTQCRRRAGVVGDPLVGAAKDEDLDECVEDEPVGDAGAVAAQRVGHGGRGQELRDLIPNGLDDG